MSCKQLPSSSNSPSDRQAVYSSGDGQSRMERMSGRTQVNFICQGRAPARSGVACPINVNHECARIDTNKAVFEIAYLRVLRVFLNLPMASEAAKRGVETCSAGRAGAHPYRRRWAITPSSRRELYGRFTVAANFLLFASGSRTELTV
jgi:hypothetical protein